MQSFLSQIESALAKNETIVIGCSCEITYSGRAEAFLQLGDRLIIIKSDKALLVHQPTGNAPINYMKPDSSHSIIQQDSAVWIKSKNLPLKEYLDVCIHAIHFVSSHPLKDGQKLELVGSEKDMSEMIYKNPSLIDPDFKSVSMEEQTKYGFIDVFGTDRNGNIVIVECKRYCADLGAVTQLRRYVERIKEIKNTDKVRGIIAAPKITPNADKMLKDWGFEFRAVSPPKYLERYRKDQKRLDGF
ncbi:endonuclease NucS [Candidatus Woesearchaeota archaeon]|nr:endonuclease NucS [Candidatus Woesearchaeota archaeon]